MKRTTILTICCCMLIVLFVYTGLIKFIDAVEFRTSVKLQPLPAIIKKILIAFLPATEIIAAVLLAFDKTRRAGLYLSFFLMISFTAYAVAAMSGYFKHVPCACMGLIQNLSWNEHLVLNIFFMIVSFVGLLIESTMRRE